MLPISAAATRAITDAAPGMVRTIAPREGMGGAGGGNGIGGASPSGPSFGDTLKMVVDRADGSQKAADAQVEQFVAGESDNVHEVMIAMNQAELHFQLLTEVRNKLLDGYQELMRMQV